LVKIRGARNYQRRDNMEEEVRYHMLRPDEIVKRRKECPAAYIPIGTLEWHGPHNPVGSDTLQAEGLAVLCARKGGGLVFPPLYYGESRLEALMEANASDREEIAGAMELSPDNFLPENHPFSPVQQVESYHRLLLHILVEAESLGFEVGVLVAGHYPLIDHARSVVLQFNQRRYGAKTKMLAWAFVDSLLVRDIYPNAGDHAGGWETSHMLHLYADRVDLDSLPPKGQPLVGVKCTTPPHDATADFGRETFEAAANVAVREVHHRLAHRELYLSSGKSLDEGIWKTDRTADA
jgi:creatinine amidohydrolase